MIEASASILGRRLDTVARWMQLREAARKRYESGRRPYTLDPIIASTRFCCVRRMDDKVSKWLLTRWYPYVEGTKLNTTLAAAGLARLINWPAALEGLRNGRGEDAYFEKWNKAKAKKHFESMKSRGEKVFTGAYIINAAGAGPGANKVDVVLGQIDEMYKRANDLVVHGNMEMTHRNMQSINGIGSFIAGQIVADLRFVLPGKWLDKDTWAPLGPGSRRGMGWLQGWDGIDAGELGRMSQTVFNSHMAELIKWAKADKVAGPIFKERMLEAHDMQNVLCETDKYFRLLHKTGRAKNKYNGH